MRHVIQQVKDLIQGKPATRRSSDWPEIRAAHLKRQPRCALCGGKEKLEVHHIRPFHLYPELERSLRNLITLCEAKRGGLNCHLAFGHLGDYRTRFNLTIRQDALRWYEKLQAAAKPPKGPKG